MFNISIVEDSQADADRLRACIERYAAERGLAFSVSRIGSAAGLEFAERVPDLIFMDVEMPGITGMEASQLIRDLGLEVPIIFVTNLAQYAIRGYEVDALDFMVKPVTFEAFVRRMDKALAVMRRNSIETIALRTREGSTVVRIDEVLYMESRGHMLEHHLTDGRVIAVRETIGAAAERLADAAFVRVNKGTLVNMRHIRTFRGKELTLSDGSTLLFGRTMRAAAVEKISAYIGGGR